MTQTPKIALLVMDMQSAMLSSIESGLAIVGNVAKAIAKARAKNISVIYVTLGFRQGAPEISDNNKGFTASKVMFTNANMKEFVKIHPAVAPLEDEIVIVKRRVSAFSGSDLEVVLRSFDIKHLVLTGIATGGIVLSTVREAADKDYILTVLSDCCADRDEEVQHVLTNKVFPRQAEVMKVNEWN